MPESVLELVKDKQIKINKFTAITSEVRETSDVFYITRIQKAI